MARQDLTAKTVPLLKLFQKREKLAVLGGNSQIDGNAKMVKIFNIGKPRKRKRVNW